MIDVAVMTTGVKCELLLIARSLGVKDVDRLDAAKCLPIWQVPLLPTLHFL